jgi:exodeoxyribonuclease-3
MSQDIKIVTWNVNSVNARIENVIFYLKDQSPDILLLQELKCEEVKFPHEIISDLGYNFVLKGQKTYNGVAILSKYPIEDVIDELPDFDIDKNDEQSRYIEAVITVNDQSIRVASIYVPNGGSALQEGQKPNETEKFLYKMRFFDRLNKHLSASLKFNEIAVFGGDYNVAHHNIDVYDPKNLDGTVCFHFDEREKFNALLNLGYLDSFRAQHPTNQSFSWWDYRGSAFKYNKGMRIDYLLTSPLASDKVKEVKIDDFMYEKPKPSDHAPVSLLLEI